MRYIVNPMFRGRGLSGLGDTQVQIDGASVLDVGNQLRTAQADLTELLDAMIADPNVARSIGRDVTAQQAALGDLITKYVGVHTAIYGTPPAGLGITPILVGVAVAGVFAVVVAGLAVWWEKESAIKQQAQAVTIASQNQAAILAEAALHQQNAQKAAAAGDAATASSEQDQANTLFVQAGAPNVTGTVPPTGPTSFVDWLQKNWVTAALIVAGVIVIPKVAGEL